MSGNWGLAWIDISNYYYMTRYGIWAFLWFDWILFAHSHFILFWFPFHGTFETVISHRFAIYGKFRKIPQTFFTNLSSPCSQFICRMPLTKKSCRINTYLICHLSMCRHHLFTFYGWMSSNLISWESFVTWQYGLSFVAGRPRPAVNVVQF